MTRSGLRVLLSEAVQTKVEMDRRRCYLDEGFLLQRHARLILFRDRWTIQRQSWGDVPHGLCGRRSFVSGHGRVLRRQSRLVYLLTWRVCPDGPVSRSISAVFNSQTECGDRDDRSGRSVGGRLLPYGERVVDDHVVDHEGDPTVLNSGE